MAYSKGIFCIEGDWCGDSHHQASVRPVLDLLKADNPRLPVQLWTAFTRDSFEHLLKKWKSKKLATMPILYLALHGDGESIFLGNKLEKNCRMTLDDIEGWLSGSCAGRIIYFGSCGSIDVHGHRLNRLLRNTQALAVCGYREDVEWMDSCIFECIVLDALQRVAATRPSMHAARDKILAKHGKLAVEMGFDMVIAKKKHTRVNRL